VQLTVVLSLPPLQEVSCVIRAKIIRENKTVDTIAKEHERTIGGITSRLRVLAYEFYEEGKTIDQIKKYTGLSTEQIADSISKREYAKSIKERKQNLKNKLKEDPIDKKMNQEELLQAVREIRDKCNKILESMA
jgi:DNA relaxase NicK